MVDRFLVWLSAGMVTAGVAAAMVAGAGVASADSPPGSDAKGTTSAESTKSTENQADSDKDGATTPNPNPSGKKPKKDAAADPTGRRRGRQHRGRDGAARPAADEQPTAATAKDAEPAGSDTAEKLADTNRPSRPQSSASPPQSRRPSKRSRSRRRPRNPRNPRRRPSSPPWPPSWRRREMPRPRPHSNRRAPDGCGRVRRTGQRGDHLHSGGAATVRSAQCDRDHRVQPVRLRDQIGRRPPDPSPEQHGHGAQFHAADRLR